MHHHATAEHFLFNKFAQLGIFCKTKSLQVTEDPLFDFGLSVAEQQISSNNRNAEFLHVKNCQNMKCVCKLW